MREPSHYTASARKKTRGGTNAPGHWNDYVPQIVDRIRARGDEIIAHARTNSENLHAFRWEADEARLIDDQPFWMRTRSGHTFVIPLACVPGAAPCSTASR
jgi:hypothetical protein